MKHVPLAFAGVGWSIEQGNIVRPLICRVSNIHEESGNLRGVPSDVFTRTIQFLKKFERFRFLATGQRLPRSMVDFLFTRLRHLLKHGASRELILLAIVKAVRSTAVNNSAVGLNLLSVCVPRLEISPDMAERPIVVSGSPESRNPTFQYWPADLWNGVSYGPSIAEPGGIAITGFEMGPITPAGERPPTEQLGGMIICGGNPSKIEFPCCLFFNPLTDCFVSARINDGDHHLAVFTDEDAVQAFLKGPSKFVRIMVRSREMLIQHLESIRNLSFIALNPMSPANRCFCTKSQNFIRDLNAQRI